MATRLVRIRRAADRSRAAARLRHALLRRENLLLRRAAVGAGAHSLARALLRVVDLLLPGCPCEVLVGDGQAGYLEVVGTRGFRAERGLGCRIPLGAGVTGAAADGGRTIWVPDVTRDPRYIPGVEGARWELAVPLCVKGGVVGVVDMESPRPRRPSGGQRRYLEGLACVLGPAFDRALPEGRVAALRLTPAGRRGGPPSARAPVLSAQTLLQEGAVEVLFQPVLDLAAHAPIGYEAELAFPSGTPPGLGQALPAGAGPSEAAGIDLARLRVVLAQWAPHSGKLFLDVHPLALRRAGFHLAVIALARDFGMDPGDLVLELANPGPNANLARALPPAVAESGLVLALDRFGTGTADVHALVELRPAFVKLDAALVRGVERDFGRRTYIESLGYYTRQMPTRLVALGISTPAELAALRRAGVTYGQGEMLGPARPLRA